MGEPASNSGSNTSKSGSSTSKPGGNPVDYLRQFRYNKEDERPKIKVFPTTSSSSTLNGNSILTKEQGVSTADYEEKKEYNLEYLKKLYPRIDESDVLQALLVSRNNLVAAMKIVNESILNFARSPSKRKIYDPIETTTVTATATSNDGIRVWKKIRVVSDEEKEALFDQFKKKERSPVKKDTESKKNERETKLSKFSLLGFLKTASVNEIIVLSGLSIKKAEFIIQCRPFTSLTELQDKINLSGKSAQLNYDVLIDRVTEGLRVRQQVSNLMTYCARLSKKIQNNLTLLRSESKFVSQSKLISEGLSLASYQLVGLNWLILLHKQNLNCILADEMGLGKTMQVIAFLAYLKENKLSQGIHLIIVPSSTIENWMNELQLWCTALNVQLYNGSQDERKNFRLWWRSKSNEAEVNAVDIILTTYNLVSSTPEDRAFFRKTASDYIIYDEAHMLKNMTTLRYKSLMKIDAKHRMLLTGTPLQNNLLELISLLVFIMPDVFADKLNDLKALFKNVKTNDNEQCEFEKEKIQQAKQIMHPFLLRRLKQDVIEDLPEKTTIIQSCEMTIAQAEIYNHLLYELRPDNDNDDASSVDSDNMGGSLAYMMQLRRSANNAALIRHLFNERLIAKMAKKLQADKNYRDKHLENIKINLYNMSDHQIHTLCKNYKSIESFSLHDDFILQSGKIRFIGELLPKLKAENHRVLIFSQFKQCLDVIADFLDMHDYTYLRLDGTTAVSDRQSLIDQYNTDESILAFLITTKAGGCGINLASADTVIINDIDLNPYNDKQAEDRCHRVGQTKPVTIYKLIAKNTIEEIMFKIAENKLTLEQQISNGSDSDCSEKELYRLLRDTMKK